MVRDVSTRISRVGDIALNEVYEGLFHKGKAQKLAEALHPLLVLSKRELTNSVTRAAKCGTECAHGEVNPAAFHDFGFDVHESCTLESFMNRSRQLDGFHPTSPRNLPVGEVKKRAI